MSEYNSHPGPAIGFDAILWARENGTTFNVSGLANAYPETDRRSERADRRAGLHTYGQHGTGRLAAVLEGAADYPDFTSSAFVITFPDGRAVAFYVAAWGPEDTRHAILHTLDDSPAGWDLTPRKTYFLRATEF